MNDKLRIGILLDDYNIPAWSYKMIEEIVNGSSGEIVLIVKNNSITEPKPSKIQQIWNNRKTIAYTLYSKLDQKLFKCTPDAFEPKELKTLLFADEIKVTPIKSKYRDEILPEDIEQIKTYNIDIFVRMGFRILRGDILKISTYGVWSYHHGDNAINRGAPAGFWEVINGIPNTGVTLQILNENLDGGTILTKSYSLTNNASVNKNKNNFYWKAQSFLPSKIKELHTLGDELFFNRITKLNEHPQFYSNRLYSIPSNKEMIRYFYKKGFNKAKNKLWSIFYFNQWGLLFKINNQQGISTSFYQFKKLLPPKDRFWADPHIISKNGKHYIFIEELFFSTNKGHISVIEMDNKGNYKAPIKVLEKNYHLSYPFIIEDKGEIYMIPETGQNNTIELYKCIDFPYKWELEKTLMSNVKAVDTTILVKDNKYWMFTNIVKNEGASSLDELFLFHADTLTSSNWVSHPLNPIISDSRTARSAGAFFMLNNNLYRPSQNNSKHYGYGMKINKVEKINEEEYLEITINNINPNWEKEIIATHTLSSSESLTIIDALMKRKR